MVSQFKRGMREGDIFIKIYHFLFDSIFILQIVHNMYLLLYTATQVQLNLNINQNLLKSAIEAKQLN